MRKQNETVYAVGYCRYSSDNQRSESIASQKVNIENYARRVGYSIIQWYEDNALTGTNDKRPAFQKMILDARKRKFKAVVVNKFDRFSRNINESFHYKYDLRKSGVTVESATEAVDNSTPNGKFMEHILEGAAKYQVDLMADEVKRGMDLNASSAVFNGGTIPFGYRKIPRRDAHGNALFSPKGVPLHDMEVDEHEAIAVRIIYDGVLADRGWNYIIEELTEKGYRTKLGNLLTYNALEKILRNEKYAGYYTFNKRKTEVGIDGHKHQVKNEEDNVIRRDKPEYRIVSPETFQAVQKIMDSRKHRPPATAQDDYLLAGRIECGECGDIYRGQKKERKQGGWYFFYKCQRRRSDSDGTPLEDKCCNCTVARDAVEKAVLEAISNLILGSNNVVQMLNAYNDYRVKRSNGSEDITKRYIAQKARLEKEITAVLRKLAVEEDSDIANGFRGIFESLKNEKVEVEKRIEMETAQQQEIKVDMREFAMLFAKVRQLVNFGKKEDRRRLIAMFLNKVAVFHDRIEIYLNTLPNALLGGVDVDVSAKALQKQRDMQILEKKEGSDEMSDPSLQPAKSWLKWTSMKPSP